MPTRSSSVVPFALAMLMLATRAAPGTAQERQATGTAPVSQPASSPAERRLPEATTDEHSVSRVYLPHADTAWAVRRALREAANRLDQPGCQSLLADFTDKDGDSLATNLARGAGDLRRHLGWVVFVDGRETRACDKGALAVTQPGSRVVRVCSSKFLSTWQQNAAFVVAILIHETLHTLGLGEDPPSSDEITSAVRRRCMKQ